MISKSQGSSSPRLDMMTPAKSSLDKDSASNSAIEFFARYGTGVQYASWLIKRGHRFRNFKRRLFCIVSSELLYFDSHDSTTVLGQMPLNASVTVTKLPHHGFRLARPSVDTYQLILYALDDESQSTWLQELQKCSVTLCTTSGGVPDNCTEPSSLEDKVVLCSGWLRKRGQLIKSLKRRWFTLTSTTLTYAVSPTSNRLQGTIRIGESSTVTIVDTAKSGEPHSFVLRVPGRALQLYADSSTELKKWVSALQDVVAGDVDNFKRSTSESFVLKSSLQEVRNEVRLLLASPYTPEGTTSAKFLSSSSTTLDEISVFVKGLTAYVVIHRLGSLRLLLLQSTEESDAQEKDDSKDQIVQAILQEVEELIFYPLCNRIYALITTKLQGSDDLFNTQRSRVVSEPQVFFGLEATKVSCWSDVITSLNKINTATLPYEKCSIYMASVELIYSTFRKEHGESSTLAADDFIPILIYCIVHSELENPLCVKELFNIFELCHSASDTSSVVVSGEMTYYITCFEIALEYLLTLPSIIPRCVVIKREYLKPHELCLKTVLVENKSIICVNKCASSMDSLSPSDVILSINGISVSDKSLEQVENLWQDKCCEEVHFNVLKHAEYLELVNSHDSNF